MKQTYNFLLIAALLLLPMVAEAQIKAENVVYKRSGDYMTVQMDLNTNGLDVPGNSAFLITPRIVSVGDSISLPAVGIYSRGRYFHYLRRNGEDMLSGKDEKVIREKYLTETIKYDTVVQYREWMDRSRLVLATEQYGCCGNVDAEDLQTLAVISPFTPQYVYVRPAAEQHKMRSLKGTAYVDFPVNITEIRPDYHSNTVELQKITATIDTVRNDNDVQLTAITIVGYASPEGSYANNARLAKGRTASLSSYVASLYKLPAGTLTTRSVPENWAGLKAYVEASNLKNKAAILSIIDSDEQPDPKEHRIRTLYPDDYRLLLNHCYPYLRRTDYEVAYNVRQFTDPVEIRQLVTTRPQKLSLEEFYIAAQDMKPGSEEFNQVYDVAVRMFPTDETANLNAANAAMAKGDYEAAERYLDRAGQSPQAIYARGICAALQKDYSAATPLLQQAQQAGISEATDALQQISEQ